MLLGISLRFTFFIPLTCIPFSSSPFASPIPSHSPQYKQIRPSSVPAHHVDFLHSNARPRCPSAALHSIRRPRTALTHVGSPIVASSPIRDKQKPDPPRAKSPLQPCLPLALLTPPQAFSCIHETRLLRSNPRDAYEVAAPFSTIEWG
ncbi:hypothetical protein B0H19DRAFT_1275019 [Mycena capillaripes]|nr:hypothetical protein B0H19DRAFT_1275019 [Mycena capillaripes]